MCISETSENGANEMRNNLYFEGLTTCENRFLTLQGSCSKLEFWTRRMISQVAFFGRFCVLFSVPFVRKEPKRRRRTKDPPQQQLLSWRGRGVDPSPQ